MLRLKESCRFLAILILFSLLFWGCAFTAPFKTTAAVPTEQERVGANENGWWQVGFQIKWPENEEALWHVDAFLALEIVSPVLDMVGGDIRCWRLHRRAARDESGHQFSFIFYCPVNTAQQIYDAIQYNADLKAMKRQGIVIADKYDDLSENLHPRISDTCDPQWPAPLKVSWPYFAMGASQMWLHLVKEIKEQKVNGQPPLSLEVALSQYQEINKAINETWRDYGHTTLLHHLNSLFAYEPVLIYEKRFMGF